MKHSEFMPPPTAPLPPRKSSGVLGPVVLAVAIIAFLAMARYFKQAGSVDQVAGEPTVETRTSPLIPTGKWTLLQTSHENKVETDLPKLGHVFTLNKRFGEGTRLWIRLPANAIASLIQATAKFGDLRPVRLAIDDTNDKRVACVFIPQNYPSQYRSCVVQLRQGTADLSSQTIDNLPPTIRTWPKPPAPTKAVRCGPAKIAVMAWNQAPITENDQVDTAWSITMPLRPGEHWALARQIKDVPTYISPKLYPQILEWDTTEALPIANGQLQSTHGSSLPWPRLQDVYRARGEIRRYETADEVVEFHNVPIRTKLRSRDGRTQTLLTDPTSPMVATSTSGVKVTLYPSERREHYSASYSNRSVLIVDYLLSPIENYPVDLPKSPVLKGKTAKVRLTLTDDTGTVLARSGSFSNDIPDALKPKQKSPWMVIVIDAKNLRTGIVGTLRLRIHHYIELESYPFSFSVPLLPGPPWMPKS